MSSPRSRGPLRLFEGYGIELEYMIVDRESLDVKPIADRLLVGEEGMVENETERGAFAWSNELARHVIEIKTNGPAPDLRGLSAGFQAEVERIDQLLAPEGARLMPGAMHPWMDPARDFELWPHGDRAIYETFHRIFDCRGHGWSNLQSTHLNLPFAGDDEFGRLHAAIRALLPLLPALAASSPYVDGRSTGALDTRLRVYRTNAERVPSVAGRVVPEPVFSPSAYEGLLEGIYDDLAPFDPAGVLRHEWVNARGCIARFDRMALEIRVLDIQESPAADLAIAFATSRVLQALCLEDAPAQHRLRGLETERLVQIFEATSVKAGDAIIDDADYAAALGVATEARPAREVWRELFEGHVFADPACVEFRAALDLILEQGCLARRIADHLGPAPTRENMARVYEALADCLRTGNSFHGPA